MKKLVLLLLALIATLGLSACNYEVVYEIDENGVCTMTQNLWYSLDDIKQIAMLTEELDSMDASNKAAVEMLKNIETPEQFEQFLAMQGATADDIVKKEVDGVVYYSSPNDSMTEIIEPSTIPEGMFINADTFKVDYTESLNSLDQLLASGGDMTEQDLLLIEQLKASVWYDFTVKMPKEIVFTNGELSADKKSVTYHFSMADKDLYFYAYTADSDQIISLGLEDGAITKKKSIKVSAAEKINSVIVNGKAVNGKKISLKEDGEYTVEVKTKNYEKTVSFIKDSTKPVVTGVENGKTYTGDVTIEFSDELSGIKSAKLGKKKIKSGKVISKAGTYTLKVTDTAGNKTTVKFTISK